MERQFGDVKAVAKTYRPDLKMFTFYPPKYGKEAGSAYPLVLCFPGGGWKKCNAQLHFAQCFVFAKYGMIAAVVEYTTNGIEHVDQCMDDAFQALHLACSDESVDKNKICVMGNSAGGQIAASLLFCTHPKYSNCPRPAWGVLSAPVMNLVQAFERKSSKFSDQRKRTGLEACKQWCPLLNLTQAKPQLLILHGKADSMVDCRLSEVFIEEFKKAGNDVRFCAYEGYDHRDWYYGNPYTRFVEAGNVKPVFGSSEKGRAEVEQDKGSLFSISLLEAINFLVDSKLLTLAQQAEDDLWSHLSSNAEALFAMK